jgi:hypothetical protein
VEALVEVLYDVPLPIAKIKRPISSVILALEHQLNEGVIRNLHRPGLDTVIIHGKIWAIVSECFTCFNQQPLESISIVTVLFCLRHNLRTNLE